MRQMERPGSRSVARADALGEMVTLTSDLADAKATIDSLAPAVSNRHYNMGKKQIESRRPS
jgi:hypothetical protein